MKNIRGATRLNHILRDLGIRSIVSETGHGNYRLSMLKGKPVFAEKRDVNHVFTENQYFQEFLKATEDAKLFCDVGGYHGFYSLISNADQNIVFEVNPDNLEILEQNNQLNPDQDLEIQEKAVWSSNGSVNIDTESIGAKTHVSDSGLQRKSITLDRFFQDRRDPDVVKIDVEGAEGHVLEGAEELLERSQPTLFIEFHFENRLSSFGHTYTEVKSFLENLGYEFTFVEGRGDEKLVVAK